jgi:hypothetical protein
MMMGKLLFTGLLVLIAVPGCGASDEPENAKQQCEDLVARFCNSAYGCAVSGGLIEASEKESNVASCKSGTSEAAECEKAQGVTSSYDRCMTKLANPPCDQVNQMLVDGELELPTECEGVILVPG